MGLCDGSWKNTAVCQRVYDALPLILAVKCPRWGWADVPDQAACACPLLLTMLGLAETSEGFPIHVPQHPIHSLMVKRGIACCRFFWGSWIQIQLRVRVCPFCCTTQAASTTNNNITHGYVQIWCSWCIIKILGWCKACYRKSNILRKEILYKNGCNSQITSFSLFPTGRNFICFLGLLAFYSVVLSFTSFL